MKLDATLNNLNTDQLKAVLTDIFNRSGQDTGLTLSEGCDLLEKRVGKEGVDTFLDSLLEADF